MDAFTVEQADREDRVSRARAQACAAFYRGDLTEEQVDAILAHAPTRGEVSDETLDAIAREVGVLR